MKLCKVLLVDDSVLFLSSVENLLSAAGDVEVVGRSFSGTEALRQVEALHPDVVLIDIAMPGLDGIEAAKLIKARADAPRVVLVTLYDNEEYRTAASSANVDGFIAKTDFSSQVIPLLHMLCST